MIFIQDIKKETLRIKNFISYKDGDQLFNEKSIAWEANQVIALQKIISSLEEELIPIQEEMNSINSDFSKKINNLTSELDKLNQQKDEAYQNKEDYWKSTYKPAYDKYQEVRKSVVVPLIDKMYDYKNSISRYYKAQKNHQIISVYSYEEIYQFKGEVKRLEKAIEQAEKTVLDSNEGKEYSIINKEYDSIRDKYYNLENQVGKVKNEIDSLKSKANRISWDFDNKIDNLQWKIKNNQKEIQQLEEKIAHTEFLNSLIDEKNSIWNEFEKHMNRYFEMALKDIDRQIELDDFLTEDNLEECSELEYRIQVAFKITKEKKLLAKAFYGLLNKCESIETLSKGFPYFLQESFHHLNEYDY